MIRFPDSCIRKIKKSGTESTEQITGKSLYPAKENPGGKTLA